jgi:protein gp37
MSDHTTIEWTDATWNPITGCAIVSPGCTNCYAMRLAGTRLQHHPSRAGLTRETKAGPVWTGEVRLNEDWLTQPLSWHRPRRIFVCAHGDLFAEGVPDEWIDRVFAVMTLTSRHVFQVLTKRPERMRDYIKSHWHPNAPPLMHWPLPNVWLGVSVEDQRRADERIPILLDTPAAVRWISAEPLLGPIDPTHICIAAKITGSPRAGIHLDALRGRYVESGRHYIGAWDVDGLYPADASPRRLDWVVAGGESGPGARPMHPDWARALRDQCSATGVPYFFKQWGNWASVYDRDRDDPDWRRVPKAGDWDRKRLLNLAGGQGFHGDKLNMMHNVGKAAAGRLLDGRTHDEMPGAPR